MIPHNGAATATAGSCRTTARGPHPSLGASAILPVHSLHSTRGRRGTSSRRGGQPRGRTEGRPADETAPLAGSTAAHAGHGPAERPAGGAEARAGGVEGRAAEEEGAPDACEGCRQVSPAEPASALETTAAGASLHVWASTGAGPTLPSRGLQPLPRSGECCCRGPLDLEQLGDGPPGGGQPKFQYRAAGVTHTSSPQGLPGAPRVNMGSSGHMEGHRSP